VRDSLQIGHGNDRGAIMLPHCETERRLLGKS